MNRNWTDFKSLNSNLSGARDAFEDACEILFKNIYSDKHVSQIKVNVGDGGIDIFVGELGVEPIIVIQCKFFLDTFDDAQKKQIRKSFETAKDSQKYKMKEWILCLPRVIDIDESSWWFKWKNLKIKEFPKDSFNIQLYDGNHLIDLFKKYNLYNKVFKIEDSLKISEIHNFIVPKKINFNTSTNPKIILFNNYSLKNESFYHEREIDRTFVKYLEINNIWVFGRSGVGKTALVNRNLLKNEIEYCFCDLSPINIINSDQVMEEIICKIEEKFVKERNEKINNKIKQLTQLLCGTHKKEIIIVIDELSVKDDLVLKEIAEELTSLVVHYSNSTNNESMKFVVSTILNPTILIENKSKASEYFQYIDCDDWINDIGSLFDKLCLYFNINLSEYKNDILESSEDSPRILKSIFRKIINLDRVNNDSIEKVIKITTDEFVR